MCRGRTRRNYYRQTSTTRYARQSLMLSACPCPTRCRPPRHLFLRNTRRLRATRPQPTARRQRAVAAAAQNPQPSVVAAQLPRRGTQPLAVRHRHHAAPPQQRWQQCRAHRRPAPLLRSCATPPPACTHRLKCLRVPPRLLVGSFASDSTSSPSACSRIE